MTPHFYGVKTSIIFPILGNGCDFGGRQLDHTSLSNFLHLVVTIVAYLEAIPPLYHKSSRVSIAILHFLEFSTSLFPEFPMFPRGTQGIGPSPSSLWGTHPLGCTLREESPCKRRVIRRSR
jgi:hypothetical protein